MKISEAIDRAVKAKWRADLINMLTDAGRTLAGTGLRANGSVYRDINIGMLLLEAARSLQECQSELEPENPDDVVVKVTVPDRWPMTEAGQRWAAQEAAAPKPMTNGDRIRAMTAEELAGKEERPKPMTNGDSIRAMTDEELAESDELLSGLCNVLHGQGYPCEANTCRECLIKWLGSPAKEAAPKPMTNSGGQTMAEYIDRVEYCEKHCRCSNEYCDRQSCPIWKAPAADVAPVVQGQWIIGVDDDDFDVKCSKCEWTDIFEVAGIAAVERIAKTMHYCLNCGAKMDGGNGGQEG